MAWLTTLLIVVQVASAIAVIILVLLQHGKGADMGAAFGGGASGSLFGATGSANFLSRSTGVVATVFFLATLGLAYAGTALKRPASGGGSIMETVPAAPVNTAPRDIPVQPQGVPPPSSAPAPQGSSAPASVPSAPATSAPPAMPATPAAPKAADVPK
jgi:preprotein translocase subunit SecG